MQTYRVSILHAMFYLFLLVLNGCGGSDEGDVTQTSLLVNIGPDRTVLEGTNVQFTATVVGGTPPYVFRWRVQPELPFVTSEDQPAELLLQAPEVSSENQYEVSLTIIDTQGVRVTDTLALTVVPDNEPPIAVVTVPAWPGLASNQFPANVAVTLDANSSVDPDGDNEALIFSWRQLAGPDVLNASRRDQSQLTFQTPILEDESQLEFELLLADEEGATDTASIHLTIQSLLDTKPTVVLISPHTVYSGETMGLVAQVSTTVESAQPLLLQWQQLTGPVATIAETHTANTFAIAPVVEQQAVTQFMLTVTDRHDNRVESTLDITVTPMPTRVMNDTGVLEDVVPSFDNPIIVLENVLIGQDSQRGNDRRWQSAQGIKAGQGLAGFDFTRLDGNGEQIDGTPTSWSCVRDNTTGLIWEVKSAQTGLHHQDDVFTWYHSEENGGFAGDEQAAAGMCQSQPCHTENYVQQVNARGLCGFFDWRLPTHYELMTLINFSLTSLLLDTDFFPLMGSTNERRWYWTRNAAADGVGEAGAQNAWAIDLLSGQDTALPKVGAARVMLVRAGR